MQGCVLLSFPTNWLRNFSLLSFLSAFGLASVALISGIGVQPLSFDSSPNPTPHPKPQPIATHHPNPFFPDSLPHPHLLCSVSYQWYISDTDSTVTKLTEWDGVPLSASIMLAGLTGHVGLPPMYSSMQNQVTQSRGS